MMKNERSCIRRSTENTRFPEENEHVRKNKRSREEKQNLKKHERNMKKT